jgi:hypothetical protein
MFAKHLPQLSTGVCIASVTVVHRCLQLATFSNHFFKFYMMVCPESERDLLRDGATVNGLS